MINSSIKERRHYNYNFLYIFVFINFSCTSHDVECLMFYTEAAVYMKSYCWNKMKAMHIITEYSCCETTA